MPFRIKLAAALAATVMAGVAAPAAPASAPPESILGDWKTQDGKSVVRFQRCGDTVCGRVQKILTDRYAQDARDVKNPDPALRSRKLIGSAVFWNLKPSGSYYRGKGYSPEDGQNFRAEIRRDGNELVLRGCVIVFCKTQRWTKY